MTTPDTSNIDVPMSFAASTPAPSAWRAWLCAALLAWAFAPAAHAAQAATPPAAAQARLSLRELHFGGNTVFSDAQLLSIAAPFIGQRLADADLKALLQRLTDVYLQAGYSTSRARLPDQDLDNGVLRVEVVEGFLEKIVVNGARGLDPAYIAQRLQVGLTTPLNVALLNANLRLLMQEPGIADIGAELSPGTRPGAAVLTVEVKEGARYAAGLRVANDRAPAVGGTRGAIEGNAHNIFGHGDDVDFTLGLASGLNDVDFRINLPWSARGPELSLRYFRAVSQLVEEQFEVFGAETRSSALDLGLSHTLWRDSGRRLQLGFNLVGKHSESTLLGQPFSFSPGVENGKADVRVARLGMTWRQSFARDSLSARAVWSAGIGALGATVHGDDAPDSQFHSLYLSLQWLHSLGPRAGSLYARAEAQLSNDGLLPLEKFSLGGFNSVRGYRRSRFVRDEGWSSSLEYRLPLLRLAVPGLARRGNDGQLSLVMFIDAGRAWNHGQDSLDALDKPTTLLAAGPGLRWDIASDTRAEIMWGGLRRHVADTGDDLQDSGFHFLVSAHQHF
ncbi:MAG: ShlB/FhaC/HecB family hemolysin secretion/activation protein [Proteobacteria bacterium]|nr:ShlB/FhaC/HecB family hemolysin secretion/activation protein [Pseudomonadota bacterium]